MGLQSEKKGSANIPARTNTAAVQVAPIHENEAHVHERKLGEMGSLAQVARESGHFLLLLR